MKFTWEQHITALYLGIIIFFPLGSWFFLLFFFIYVSEGAHGVDLKKAKVSFSKFAIETIC